MYGKIIYPRKRPSAELINEFKGIWTSTLADTMGRHGVMNSEIRPIFENIKLIGVALTVLNYPNDNITTHKALQLVEPGDILVVDETTSNMSGSFGHNMSLEARKNGALGFVSNGHIRDLSLLRKDQFPVFSKGICPRSAQKNTPGSVNVPVSVGGIVIKPGDIIIGDDDGVAVIPLEDAESILAKAKERMEMELQQAKDINNGQKPLEIVFGDNWLDKALKGKITELK